jgi:hypothetical protein
MQFDLVHRLATREWLRADIRLGANRTFRRAAPSWVGGVVRPCSFRQCPSLKFEGIDGLSRSGRPAGIGRRSRCSLRDRLLGIGRPARSQA